MATLVLQTVGTAVGALFGPVGAAVGAAVGGMIGASLDQALLGGTSRRSGPRLDNLQVMASTEGAPVPRLYGTMRLSGQVIWATELEEAASTRKVGPKGARQTITEYAYFANLAVGLCGGPNVRVGRVWADGRPLDRRSVVMRVHGGSEAQSADSLVNAKEPAGGPGYRGLAYVVFERLPLEDYGNRVPQLTFEVTRPVGGLETMVRAMTLIPGTGEFVYEDRVVTERRGLAQTGRVNRHMASEAADFVASVDELKILCPSLRHVSLVVTWFGDDLRAGRCTVAPRVETAAKSTAPVQWAVAGLTRGTARIVSADANGRPNYGGTPSDESVRRAIAHLKARGLSVTLYPFVMMDIPPGNGRQDPATGAANQPAFPWRGRITVDPAPGRPGSPDGAAAAASQVQAFFGSASDWTYRRMIRHYATLAEAAGGVDAFVVGSELIGLTRVRSAPGVYPAVGQLAALAGEVKSILRSGTKVVYGADWTEYGAHVLGGGSEVRFPLDPLFAASAIDAVALDWYAPLSDWREGTAHLDAVGARAIHDLAYLTANVAGGEGYDWYYASEADRQAQRRAPIADGAYGKPWMFRQKDLLGWWSSSHVERVGGVELPAPTAWVPRSKPIWLLECGAPAVDKGTNQPSAFPDPKSAENALPYFSDGSSDPLVQARAAEALIAYWSDAAVNPVSPSYGGRMVDIARLYLWAWDARPYPAFPNAVEAWSDGGNWTLGHWLNGRLGQPTLARLVARILADGGEAAADTSGLDGIVVGAVIDRPISARAAIEPLARAFGFAAIDRAGTLVFRHLGGVAAPVLRRDDVVEAGREPVVERVRAQETELPRGVTLAFVDPDADFTPAVEISRRLDTASRGEERIALAAALPRPLAARLADTVLQDAWVGRETVRLSLPPSRLAIEPGDVVALDLDGRERLHLVTGIEEDGRRIVSARRFEPAVLQRGQPARLPGGFSAAEPDALPYALLLDLPVLPDGTVVHQWLAATAIPWPGALALWRSGGSGGFTLSARLSQQATMGRLAEDLPAGPPGRWLRGASVLVEEIGPGRFVSLPEDDVLDGANALAVRRGDGGVEVLQFAAAELVGAGLYRLSGLMRGVLGTDGPSVTIQAGAEAVLIDEALMPLVTKIGEVGRSLRWRVGPARVDHGDDAVRELVGAAGHAALRPYAPAHPRARRGPAGIALTWIRRTRIGGDAWESAEVPLSEDGEAYQVDILRQGVVARTFAVSAPAAFYTAADEIADFGAPQTRLTIRVAQMSALAGRGTEKEATLDV